MMDRPSPDALHHAAQALADGRVDEAEAVLAPWLATCPDDVDVLRLAGPVLFARGRTEEAVACLLEAGRRLPGDAWAWGHLLEGLAAAGQVARGLSLCRDAVCARPDLLPLMRRMAPLAVREGDFTLVRQLAELGPPGDPWLGFCLSSAVLRSGQWRDGFTLYEHRWVANGVARATPDWGGTPDPSGVLVVYAEQGMGDVLQFLRFLPALRRRHGGRLVLRVHPPLVVLLAGWADQVMASDEPASAIRLPSGCTSVACTPLMSAPWLLERLGENVSVAAPPYLQPPAALIEAARPHLGKSDGRPRVGLAWGGTSHAIPLDALLPLLDEDRVAWVSLQFGAQPGDTRLHPAMAGGNLARAAGLAALCDLVVTVDTSIAHLAACQGIPTWVLLDEVCCWRWTDHGDGSVWYPSVRLFRQRKRCGWAEVAARVRAALTERF